MGRYPRGAAAFVGVWAALVLSGGARVGAADQIVRLNDLGYAAGVTLSGDGARTELNLPYPSRAAAPGAAVTLPIDFDGDAPATLRVSIDGSLRDAVSLSPGSPARTWPVFVRAGDGADGSLRLGLELVSQSGGACDARAARLSIAPDAVLRYALDPARVRALRDPFAALPFHTEIHLPDDALIASSFADALVFGIRLVQSGRRVSYVRGMGSTRAPRVTAAGVDAESPLAFDLPPYTPATDSDLTPPSRRDVALKPASLRLRDEAAHDFSFSSWEGGAGTLPQSVFVTVAARDDAPSFAASIMLNGVPLVSRLSARGTAVLEAALPRDTLRARNDLRVTLRRVDSVGPCGDPLEAVVAGRVAFDVQADDPPQFMDLTPAIAEQGFIVVGPRVLADPAATLGVLATHFGAQGLAPARITVVEAGASPTRPFLAIGVPIPDGVDAVLRDDGAPALFDPRGRMLIGAARAQDSLIAQIVRWGGQDGIWLTGSAPARFHPAADGALDRGTFAYLDAEGVAVWADLSRSGGAAAVFPHVVEAGFWGAGAWYGMLFVTWLAGAGWFLRAFLREGARA